MSALTEEHTYDDYHELINITYISWHYSSLRHTICGTCKVDVEDDIHIASHCALLCKHSNWPPVHGLFSDSAFSSVWSDGLEWSPSCTASDDSGPLCSIYLWP